MERRTTVRNTNAMKTTVTKLRQNLYRYLDRVVETGVPIEVERKGHTIRIVSGVRKSKLENLRAHDALAVTPEEIIHGDWLVEWDGGKEL